MERGEEAEAVPQGRMGWDTLGLLLFLALLGALALYSRVAEERYANYNWSTEGDLYAVLEAAPGASLEQLRKSYRRLVLRFHPDRNPGCADCLQRSTELQQAWETLGNVQRRDAYDETRNAAGFIRSRAVELSAVNAARLLAAEHNVVVVQVYENGDEACQIFAAAWERAVEAFPFIEFARLNRRRESALLRALPFGVREVPFVFAVGPGLQPQFADLDLRRDNFPLLRDFLAGLFSTVAPAKQEAVISLRSGEQSLRAKFYAHRLSTLFGLRVRFESAVEGAEQLVLAADNPETHSVRSSPFLFQGIEQLLFHRSPPGLSRGSYLQLCDRETRMCLLLREGDEEVFRAVLSERMEKEALSALAGQEPSKFQLVMFDLRRETHPRLERRLAALTLPSHVALAIHGNEPKLTLYDAHGLLAGEKAGTVPFESFLQPNESFADLLRTEGFSLTKAFLSTSVNLFTDPKLIGLYVAVLLLATKRGGRWLRAVAVVLIGLHLSLSLQQFRSRFYL